MTQESGGGLKVSVIVAAFNQERFIGRCLRSLLRQTLPHEQYEVVVVNDGSTDRTGYALELFHDSIRVVTNPKNRGLPASLNTGLQAARAPLVVRVDADDFVNAHFLTVLSLYLDMNPDADAVACDYLLIDDNEQTLERVSCAERPIACGIMFRSTQLFEIGLYDETFLRHEEREMRIRFEHRYSIRRLEFPLYRYRRHHNNITNDTTEMDRFEQQLVRKHGLQPAQRNLGRESS